MNTATTEHVAPATTRPERLEMLMHHFLTVLHEDPQDGTDFDHAVMRAIDALKEEFKIWHVVEYHACGGQMCVLGRRSFDNEVSATRFAESEEGHCDHQGVVKVFTSDRKLEDLGM